MWTLPRLTRAIRNFDGVSPLQTRWVVLSGPPSSGKSTVLEQLDLKGFETRTEVALDYILELRAMGRSLKAATADKYGFTAEIIRRGIDRETRTNPNQVVVFDRSLVDVLAFALVDGLELAPLLPLCLRYKFARAFVFDSVELRDDETIYHDGPQLQAIAQACSEIYEAFNCPVVKVPSFSRHAAVAVEKRTSLVANEIWAATSV